MFEKWESIIVIDRGNIRITLFDRRKVMEEKKKWKMELATDND